MDLWAILERNDFDFSKLTQQLPCYLHINELENFALLYIDPRLINRLAPLNGETLEEATKTLSFVNQEDLEAATKSVRYYLDHHEEFSMATYLQRVHTWEGWITLYTTSKLVPELGGLVSFSVEIDEATVNDQQIDNLLAETKFIKTHLKKFITLTAREREFVSTWVMHQHPEDLAKQLAITASTAKTYKKRIYAKLGIHSYAELLSFARAFDLTA